MTAMTSAQSNLPTRAPRFSQSENVARSISMTSLELVDFINDQRKQQAAQAGQKFPGEGFSKLQHKHFLDKVPEVLGERSAEFSANLPDSYGRPRKGYRFPKREACLMAMSYSYELQALVFDRMTALEEAFSSKAFVIPQTRADALRLAADLEEQNTVLLIENSQQAKKIESLESIFQPGMTPTQFCKRLNGVNCQQVNNTLLARNWIFNSEREPERSVKYRVGCKVRDKYLTEKLTTISNEGADPFPKYTPILLKAGAKRLHELYMQRRLPMKKTWDGLFTHDKVLKEAE